MQNPLVRTSPARLGACVHGAPATLPGLASAGLWAPAEQGWGSWCPGECERPGPSWRRQAGTGPGRPCLPWALVPAGWASGMGGGRGRAPHACVPRPAPRTPRVLISGARGFVWGKRPFGAQRTPLSGPGPVQEPLQNHVRPQVGGAQAAPCGVACGGAGPDSPGGSSPPHTHSPTRYPPRPLSAGRK